MMQRVTETNFVSSHAPLSRMASYRYSFRSVYSSGTVLCDSLPTIQGFPRLRRSLRLWNVFHGLAACYLTALSYMWGQAVVQEVIRLDTITLPVPICIMTLGPRATVNKHTLHGVNKCCWGLVLRLVYRHITGRGYEMRQCNILSYVAFVPDTIPYCNKLNLQALNLKHVFLFS